MDKLPKSAAVCNHMSPCCQPADACMKTYCACQMSMRAPAGGCTPPPPATAAVCLQIQDSAMLTRIQGMVGVGSPLSAAVTQLKDRITSAATR